jgi:DHA2 family methylenomycin A resistance protein-like MFS transporter
MSVTDGGIARPHHRMLALLAVFAASLLAMLDLSISAVALPVVREDLNASLAGLQWIFDAYTLAFASLLLVGGLISDRLGHRTGLLLSMGLFVAGSALCAFAGGVGMLIAGRAVQGTAAAMLIPASMAMITWLAGDADARARLLGVWSGLTGAAIALGPVLGGWLVHTSGWRIIFAINLPLGALVLVLILVAAPRITPGTTGRLDVPGLVLGALWSLALAYGIIEGVGQGWTSPVIIGSFVVAVLAFVAFLVVESRTAHPMMPVSLFRSMPFASASVIAFVLGFGLSSSFYFLSQFLQLVLGYSSLGAGLGFLPAALTLTVIAPIAGMLVGRFGPRALVAAGLLCGAGGLFGLSLAGADTGYGGLWWAVALVGIGWGLALPPVNTVALGSVPPERVGGASGTVETALQFGTVVGIAALGAVQLGDFIHGLRARLLDVPVAEPELTHSTTLLSTGRITELTSAPPDVLARISAHALAHGLHLAFLVGSLVTLAAVVVAGIGLPRAQARTPAAEPAPARETTDSTAIQP